MASDIRIINDLVSEYDGYYMGGTVGFKNNNQLLDDAGLAAFVGRLKDIKTPFGLGIEHEQCKKLTPAGLVALKDAKCVTTLYVKMPGLKVAMPAIGQMTQLDELFINDDMLEDADLAPLAKLANLKKLSLFGSKLTPACFKHIADLKELEALGGIVIGAKYRDEDLAHLKGLSKLKKLDIEVSRPEDVTDAGFANLKGMTGLETLHTRANITPASLDVIAGLPRLTSLSLYGAGATGVLSVKPDDAARLLPLKDRLKKLRFTLPGDEWLEHAGQLTALEELDFAGGLGITDAGVAKLTGLKNLRKLDLGLNNVTDAGIAKLAALPNLTFLQLKSNPITNAAVTSLKGCDKLEYLSLWDTPVTNDAAPTIKAMPGLKSLVVTGTKMTKEVMNDLKASRKWENFFGD